jgi:thioredoxin-related protein
MRWYIGLIGGLLWAQASGGITFFTGSWSQLLQEAQKQKRPIFVDVYAEWCGPCKMLERNTFPNPDLGAYVAKHYIAYRLDGEKGEGPKIANQYRVRAYPTMLFLDPSGKELGRQVGYVDAPTLLRILQQYYAVFDKSRSDRAPTWESFQESYSIYVSTLATQAWGSSFAPTYQAWHAHLQNKDYEAAQKLSATLTPPLRETLEALTRLLKGEQETALRILHYDLFTKGKLSPAQLLWVCAYQLMYAPALPPEALQWSTYAVRKDPFGAGFLTHAAVAYRLTRYAEAQTALKEAQKEIPPTDPALSTLQHLVSAALRQK